MSLITTVKNKQKLDECIVQMASKSKQRHLNQHTSQYAKYNHRSIIFGSKPDFIPVCGN